MGAFNWILSKLPYQSPFLFVDSIESVDDDMIVGYYRFTEDSDFYKGHFINNPITPGVILSETMAQIGVVCFGIYLLKNESLMNVQIGLSSIQSDYYIPVLPGEKVKVISKKVYFRFHKLKCVCEMYNKNGKLVAKAEIAGMMKISDV